MPSYDITSLNDFIIRQQKDFPYARGELSSLLHHIGTAAKMVNASTKAPEKKEGGEKKGGDKK